MSASFGIIGKVHAPEREEEDEPASHSRLKWVWWIVALLLAFALYQFTSVGWVYAKATLAQHLIARSWEKARVAGHAERPWPWADTRAVAMLSVPSRGVQLYVLDGTSGRSLAFGPGHVNGTAAPGSEGNSVILAHRDTHFAFLKDLGANEAIDVETAKGTVVRYRVREAVIVDKSETRVLDAADSAQLTLITCYPFDAVMAGTPLRYVVIADRVAQNSASSGRPRGRLREVVGVRGFEPPASTSRT